MATVFKISNNRTGKSLIGTTVKEDVNDAFREWMKNCTRQKYADYLIYKDYKAYGKESFSFTVLTTCESKGEAFEIADSYIIQFNTLEPYGYNKSFTGIRKKTPDYYGDNPKTMSEEQKLAKNKTIRKTDLLKKYGINGVEENNVPQIFAEQTTINALRDLANKLEMYGNNKVAEFVPAELNVETNELQDELISLIDGRALKGCGETFIAHARTDIQCSKCNKYKDIGTFFFKHPDINATSDGYIHICKQCIEEYCISTYNFCNNAFYTIITLCQLTNVIFVQDIAQKAANAWEVKQENTKEIFKYYMSELKYCWLDSSDTPSSMLEFRHSNFKGDIFSFSEHHPATPKVFIEELNEDLVLADSNALTDEQETLETKWGTGFTPQEYKQLEQEYTKLEKFLPKKTDLHIEALKKYVIYNMKEKMALAKGDLKDVKEWSGLADKAADNAQLKIKQLSENFDSGVDSFSKLVETVEEYYSVIPTLPKARKMPYDDIDFLVWQNVNYIRRLEGKPEADYEDIYYFIDDELTKKMRDSGMTDEEIAKAKEERNAIFKDLSDTYQEPLWLIPTADEDEEDDED